MKYLMTCIRLWSTRNRLFMGVASFLWTEWKVEDCEGWINADGKELVIWTITGFMSFWLWSKEVYNTNTRFILFEGCDKINQEICIELLVILS